MLSTTTKKFEFLFIHKIDWWWHGVAKCSEPKSWKRLGLLAIKVRNDVRHFVQRTFCCEQVPYPTDKQLYGTLCYHQGHFCKLKTKTCSFIHLYYSLHCDYLPLRNLQLVTPNAITALTFQLTKIPLCLICTKFYNFSFSLP